MSSGDTEKTNQNPLVPVLGVAVVGVSFFLLYQFYLKDMASLTVLASMKNTLATFTQANVVLVFVASAFAYMVATAVLMPSVSWLSITISYIFGAAYGIGIGTAIASMAVFLGVLAGVPVVFIVVRTIVQDRFRKRFGPAIDKFAKGVESNALFYIIAMRLIPLIPYVVVNAAPALVNVKLATHMLATAMGVFPGILVFAYLGASLTTVVQPTGIEVTWHVFAAFTALGFLSLLPIVLKSLAPGLTAYLLVDDTPKNDT